MAESSTKKRTLHIEMREESVGILGAVAHRAGMKKVEATARIFEWFVALPPTLQAAVMSRDQAARSALLRAAIVEMAGGGPGVAPSEEDLIQTIRHAVDQLEMVRQQRVQQRSTSGQRRSQTRAS